VVPGITTWAVVNNMLENTQVVFTTAAVLSAVAAVSTGRPAAAAGAGALVAAAVLTKGPVGLFPLSVPLLYAVFVDRGRLRAALGATAVIVATLALVAGGLTAYAPAREALGAYLHSQVGASLAGTREVAAAGRGGFGQILFVDILAGMAALLLVIWALAPRPRARIPADAHGLFFIAVGLAGSVPIAISPKLMGHYFVAAIPMFALGFGRLAWPLVAPAFDRLVQRRLRAALPGTVGVMLLLAAVAVPLTYGAIEPRDEGLVRSLRILGSAFPERPIIAICPGANDEWSLHAYVQRFYKGSLDASGTPRELFLRVMDRDCPVPDRCVRTRFAGGLELYSCT
jgi:4-amino-4-deoxy-L-arabinose transferase-like glycosyltransferase